jgi:hypothetical protein
VDCQRWNLKREPSMEPLEDRIGGTESSIRANGRLGANAYSP